MMSYMQNEIKIMYSLNHKHILKMFNHYEDNKDIVLVLEVATGVKKLLNY